MGCCRIELTLGEQRVGAAALKVADHDDVSMPFGDGVLVDADNPGSRSAGPANLFLRVLLVQILDSLPIKEAFLNHFLDRSSATLAVHEEGETLGLG